MNYYQWNSNAQPLVASNDVSLNISHACNGVESFEKLVNDQSKLPEDGALNPIEGALTPTLCDPPKLDDGWLYEYPCGLAAAKAMHDKTTNTFIFVWFLIVRIINTPKW